MDVNDENTGEEGDDTGPIVLLNLNSEGIVLIFACRTPLKGYSSDGSSNRSLKSPAKLASSGDSSKENFCDTKQARRIHEHAQNVKKALQMHRSSSSDL